MNKKEFKENLLGLAIKENINITDPNAELFYKYMNLLIEWNEKVNLTSIVEPQEIIVKHFIDSLIVERYVKDNNSIIDVGTGAGFPGIPLKIQNNSLKITLLDSLNKRIKFLNEVICLFELYDVEAIHGRAEDFGMEDKYREKYDICVSRAVAKLNVLAEYMLPFVKIGGQCLCMKGPNLAEEIEEAEKAIKKLGGKIKKIDNFILPDGKNERNIVIISKISSTKNEFPRNAGKIKKAPIK